MHAFLVEILFSFFFRRTYLLILISLQSTSGVSVNPDVQRSFQRLSDSKEYRYILFKIEVCTFSFILRIYYIETIRYRLYYRGKFALNMLETL